MIKFLKVKNFVTIFLTFSFCRDTVAISAFYYVFILLASMIPAGLLGFYATQTGDSLGFSWEFAMAFTVVKLPDIAQRLSQGRGLMAVYLLFHLMIGILK